MNIQDLITDREELRTKLREVGITESDIVKYIGYIDATHPAGGWATIYLYKLKDGRLLQVSDTHDGEFIFSVTDDSIEDVIKDLIEDRYELEVNISKKELGKGLNIVGGYPTCPLGHKLIGGPYETWCEHGVGCYHEKFLGKYGKWRRYSIRENGHWYVIWEKKVGDIWVEMYRWKEGDPYELPPLIKKIDDLLWASVRKSLKS